MAFTLILGGCGSGSLDLSTPSNDVVTDGIFSPDDSLTPDDDTGVEVLPDEPVEDEIKKKAYVKALVNSLRVRNGASGQAKTVGYLDKGDLVVLTGETENYYKTVYKESVAYVYKSYCTIVEVEMANDSVEKAIELGSSLLGYPYVWGSQRYHWGNGKLNSNFVKGEFDCSALVQYVYYLSNAVILDVTTRTQVKNGVEVDIDQLSRGDLMFFTNESRKNKTGIERIGHVGIYFGDNYILHTASDHAVIEPISQTRWSYFESARRVV